MNENNKSVLKAPNTAPHQLFGAIDKSKPVVYIAHDRAERKSLEQLGFTPVAQAHKGGVEAVITYYQDADKIVPCLAASNANFVAAVNLATTHRISLVSTRLGGTCNPAKLSDQDRLLLILPRNNNKQYKKVLRTLSWLLSTTVPFYRTAFDAAQMITERLPQHAKHENSYDEALFEINKYCNKHESVVTASHSISYKARQGIEVKKVNGLSPELVSSMLDSKRAYILKIPTGIGKTTKAMIPAALAAYNDGYKPTYISHLISISEFIQGLADEFTSYKEELDRIESAEALNLVINSLCKSHILEYASGSKVLLIDEASKVISALATNDEMYNAPLIFRELRKLIKNAELVILADADASDFTVEFLKTLRDDVTLIEMEPKHSDITVHFDRKGAIEAQINEAYCAGETIGICTDSLKQLKSLAADMGIEDTTADVLLITGENKACERQAAFLANPDAEIGKYRVVAWSPAMGSSVGITKPHFDKMFAMVNGTVAPIEMIQMFRRYRPATEIYMGIAEKNSRPVSHDILAGIEAVSRTKGGEYETFASGIRQEKEYLTATIQSSMLITLTNHGFKIVRGESVNDVELAKEAKRKERETAKAGKNAYETGIAEAIDIGLEEAKERMSSQSLYQAEIYERDRALAKHELCINDMEIEHIKLWEQGAIRDKLRNLECWQLNQFEASNLDFKERYKSVMNRNYHSETRNALKTVMGKLGLNLEKGGVYTRYEAIEVAQYAQRNHLVWNQIGVGNQINQFSDYTRNDGRAAMNWVAGLLKAMGIKTGETKKTVDGRKIKAKKWRNNDDLKELLAKRKVHGVNRYSEAPRKSEMSVNDQVKVADMVVEGASRIEKEANWMCS